jgi:hypothetical protein
MSQAVPSEVLKHVREAAGISLAVLATQMNTVASVLSKVERATEADPELAERYLSAIGSALAQEVKAYYARPWFQERPPSFLHPDAATMWLIDQALKELQDFEASNTDSVLRGPISLWRKELQGAETFLSRRDHVVAWVGDIGVGKTTALSHAVGLLVGDGRSGRKPAFPVGSGRTTVCETAIRVAPTFGVLVDTLDDEEVIRLTRDLVASLTPGSAGRGVPAEVGRVLRNMSKMSTSLEVVGDEPTTQDPIADLLKSGVGPDEIADRMIAEMNLGDRKERQIILPEGREDGLTWVSRLVAKINNGLDDQFGVPSRITVLMPSDNLSADGQLLSVVDTRGLEGLTQRKDLIDLDEEERALMVLCTKFADAPNISVQRMLQEAVAARSGALDRKRKCILVLPRGDEALEMPGFDEPLTSRAQGYAIRRQEIEQALTKAQLPQVPVYFFDARNDAPDKIWAQLRGQIGDMRAAFRDRAQRAADGVTNLRENTDAVLAIEARLNVEEELVRVLDKIAPLPDSMRPAYQNLVDQMAVGHHSSIAASVARRGKWDGFHFAQILGQGVRIDANQRSNHELMRVEHKLDELDDKWSGLPSVAQTLQGLRQRLNDGRQEFLAAARSIGVDAYGALLSGEAEVWGQSARRYGQGSGYKRDIADIWRDWFLASEKAAETSRTVGQRLQDAWTVWVLSPLRDAVQPDGATPDL